jgi:hypothetical protein
LVPHQEGWALHLSQASLPASAKEKSRVSLLIKVDGEEPVVLCTLCAGVSDTVLLVSELYPILLPSGWRTQQHLLSISCNHAESIN